MHEFSVCLSLLEQVKEIAAQHGATRVDRIRLQIGPLSGVEPTLLEQAYPLVASATIAAEAELVIEAMPVRVDCQDCGSQSEVEPNRLLCAHCGGYHTRLRSGNEMLLANLELTVPGD